jgi:hypothetical protein
MNVKHGLLALSFVLGLGFGTAAAQTPGGNTGSLIGGDGLYIFKTVPMAAGTVIVGQGAAADPSAFALSGDCTLNASGVITCTKTNGSVFGTAAAVNTGTSGSTLPVLSASNTWSTGTLQTFLGHVAAGTSPPVLTSCGSGSPTILGDDKDGVVTMGTSATGCVITFATAYTSAPLCTVSWQATPLASQSYTVSTTALTTVQTSASGNKLNYHCTAQNGG